ncbi:hypothetical protein [Chondromyces crocatus]|uniref:Uncharacterized protein n=1 Tax=Chondromyces crocatus TaxID=52 RepID=A0A0K1ERR5_CHOCO|nr:hypothetical protein [Chondromyces crocatus]AKT43536.1 uncharacterized protein CMC5_077680 [Chondromyces crocatus]
MPRRDLAKRVLLAGFALACLTGAAFSATVGCSGWDPSSPFERNAPAVDQAIQDLDAGRLESAEDALTRYLGTGQCSDAGIGLPDAVRQKPNGSFDLGLTLFYMAERYGRRFGDEEQTGGAQEGEDDPQAAQRNVEIDCALIIVQAIAADPTVPADLRARARYLVGNLEFLRRRYKEAVASYDQALAIIPGLFEEAGGDGIGRDAAWNRAIALRRIEDQERDAAPDSPPDAPPDPPPDGGEDGGDDGGDDAGNDGGDDGGDDAGNDGGGEDAGDDGGQQDQQPDAGDTADGGPQDDKPDAGGQPPPQQPPPQQPQEARQDERVLDQFEEAPTYQEEEAKNRGLRRGRVMEDK